MYNLFYSRIEGKIEIRTLRKVFHEQKDKINSVPYRYNGCYYFCSERKPLVELANKIKLEWLTEVEAELNRLKGIKVKSIG